MDRTGFNCSTYSLVKNGFPETFSYLVGQERVLRACPLGSLEGDWSVDRGPQRCADYQLQGKVLDLKNRHLS
jgi:hypothetical protein